MNNWLVYLLECADNSYYCGVTNDLNKRLTDHNSGKGAKYTRSRLPVKVLAERNGLSKSQAFKLEHLVKKKARDKKITFLSGYTTDE